MAHAPAHQGTDRRAAFTGLIVGAVVTVAILYATVQWTNARFAGHEGAAAPAASATH